MNVEVKIVSFTKAYLMSFKHIKVNRVIILDGAGELSELDPANQQRPLVLW